MPHFRSLRLTFSRLDDVLSAVYFLNCSAYELDALDFYPTDDGWMLLARLGGFAETLPQRLNGFKESMARETSPVAVRELDDTAALWHPLADLSRAHVAKVVLSPTQIPAFDAQVANMQRRYGAGGNVAWVSADELDALDTALSGQGLTGLCLQGEVASPLIGAALEDVLAARVKQVLDPLGKLV